MKHRTTTSALALLCGLLAAPAVAQDTAAKAEPPAPGLSGGHGPAPFMASYDLDGDGSVTLGDYFAIRSKRFAEADTDKNGTLSEAEYVAEYQARLDEDYKAQGRSRDEFYDRGMAQSMDRFHLLDLNNDRQMDRAEFFAQADKTFARLDTNGDGVVDANDPAPERRARADGPDFAGITEFKGRVSAAGPEQAPIYPGTEVTIAGRGLASGQKLTLQRGTARLNDEPIVVGEDGSFRFGLALSDAATPGLYPVQVIGEGPDAVTSFDLKVSPKLDIAGAEAFPATTAKGAAGLYQSAYSAASDALFVSATAFAGPGGGAPASTLTKVSPETLEVLAQVTIPESAQLAGESAPEAGAMAKVPAVFGIAVDDAAGTVWVTNTIQGTAAVYAQSDLSLIKQFDKDLVRHSREVVIDEARHRAYVSASASNEIGVFDTEKLEYLTTIRVVSAIRGGEFTTMGLALDAKGGRLFAVSRSGNEVAEIDTETGTVARILSVPGAKNSSGIAYDAASDHLLVASQDSDDLIALDAKTGDLVFTTPVGAGAMAVAVADGLAYVANRGAGTVTVVDGSGAVVANLDIGSYPNHVEADDKGRVFITNKARGPQDATGDHLTRLR